MLQLYGLPVSGSRDPIRCKDTDRDQEEVRALSQRYIVRDDTHDVLHPRELPDRERKYRMVLPMNSVYSVCSDTWSRD